MSRYQNPGVGAVRKLGTLKAVGARGTTSFTLQNHMYTWEPYRKESIHSEGVW